MLLLALVSRTAVRWPISRLLSVSLSILIAAYSGVADAQVSAPVSGAPQVAPAAPLKIAVLEGANAVNSTTQLRAISPVVEIRDQNDFPVEGATVVFTLPDQGALGTFVGGGNSFTTRSDSRGQASTPLILPRQAGKFEIKVSASAGDRKGDAVIRQTNSDRSYVGPQIVSRPWYKRWKPLVIIGGATVVTVVLVVVLTSGSKSSSTVITPGVPVFQ